MHAVVQLCVPEVPVWKLTRQIADARSTDRLRDALNVLNEHQQSAEQHDVRCTIESRYVRGLVGLRAGRDAPRGKWMYANVHSLENTLSCFNDALLRIRRAHDASDTSYEQQCSLGQLERTITREAIVAISILERVHGRKVEPHDTPSADILLNPAKRDIEKAQLCGIPLHSLRLPARALTS